MSRKPLDLSDAAFDVPHISGMTPWICEYRKEGKLYTITLYGTSAEQVAQENRDALDGFKVLGELHSAIPADDAVAQAMIDARKRRDDRDQ